MTNRHFVFVVGEVKRPGRIVWTNGLTLTNAVQMAGGFTDFADKSRLEVRHVDGAVEVYSFMQAEAEPTNNPALKSGDQVAVPKRRFF